MGNPKRLSLDKKCILPEDNGVEQRTDWRSIYVAAALSFVGSVQFSLYFSSLWPYLQLVDKSATETFFGYIVACYSVGQIISSPSFGFWSNKLKQVRLPLFTGLSLMLLGNLLYVGMELVSFPKKFLLLLGRFITGAGSGNVILLRTYASTASTFKDRPRAIAYVTCGQALGTTCGPALQLLFVPLGYPGWRLFGLVSLNMYTAPAYFACFMNIAGAIALRFLFREKYAGILEESSSKNGSKNGSTAPALPMYDILAVLVCYGTRFTQMFINTNLETIGSAFAMMMFGWAESKAVTITAIAQGVIGICTFLTYIFYIFLKLENYISSRKACMISLLALIVFHVVTFSWPFIPGHVTMHNNSALDTDDRTGCNTDKFSWCESLRPVNPVLYYVMYAVVIGFAFPTMNITVTILFSKILGPRRQGTQQGIFQVSGGIARMLGPISISVLYTHYGPRMAWYLEIAVIALTLLAWCLFYRRMVPLAVAAPLESVEVSSTSDCGEDEPELNKVAPRDSFSSTAKSDSGSSSSSSTA